MEGGCSVARDKNLPELFEAFRMSREEQKAAKSEEEKVRERKAGEQRAVQTQEKSPAKVKKSPAAGERPVRREGPGEVGGVGAQGDLHILPLGEPARVLLALSYNALIVVIIVFVVFAVLVGFFGYQLGTRSAGTPGEPVVKKGPSQPPSPPTRGGAPARGGRVAPAPPVKAYFRVQVLTVPNTPARLKALDEDMEFLKRQRVPDLVKRPHPRQRMVSLFAGAFSKDQRSDAERLAARLRLMTVRGRAEFKDARVVTISQ